MPWRERFCAEYARVTGESAGIEGPLQERYFRVSFSRCGGPWWERREIERITAWMERQENKINRLTIRKTK